MVWIQSLNILLLCENEAMAGLDRRALREAGANRVECLTSGVAAARILAKLDSAPNSPQPDVVVCSQRLADMTGEQFCSILRLHPLSLGLPILLILPNDSEMEQLKMLGCGASALLARPYSIDQLKAHLDSLSAAQASMAQLNRADHLTDTKDFDNALATYGLLLKPVRQPEDFFRVGMQCLEQHKWNNAIDAFQRALRGALIQGKAELGMAAAWRGKGDTQRYRHYLALAASTFVRAQQWSRARAVYARLLQEDPSARSPFLSEAMRYVRAGDYDKAAGILTHGYEITPRQQISEKIAQTCLASENPQIMLKNMESALERSLGSEAEALSFEVSTKVKTLAKEIEAKRLENAAEHQWHAARQAPRPPESSDSELTHDQADFPMQTRQNKILPVSKQTALRHSTKTFTPGQRTVLGVALTEDQKIKKQTACGSKFSQSGQEFSSPVIALWGEQDKDPPPAASGAVSPPDGIPANLDPLAKKGGGFRNKVSLGDLFSVMKLTWRLARQK